MLGPLWVIKGSKLPPKDRSMQSRSIDELSARKDALGASHYGTGNRPASYDLRWALRVVTGAHFRSRKSLAFLGWLCHLIGHEQPC